VAWLVGVAALATVSVKMVLPATVLLRTVRSFLIHRACLCRARDGFGIKGTLCVPQDKVLRLARRRSDPRLSGVPILSVEAR